MSIKFDSISVSDTIYGTGVTALAAVRAASTANGILSADFEAGDTMDGVTLADGDRILIKNQTTALENGIYTVQTSGSPLRTSDFAEGANVAGSIIAVEEGTTNADTTWLCTNNSGSDIVGTSAIAFQQMTGPGTGGVTGPASSTDNAIARWDGTGGTSIQDSGATLGDNGNLVLSGSSAYIDLPDIAAPSNPGANIGRLYKKSGNDSIFWRPDSSGPEVSLTDLIYYSSSETNTVQTTTTSDLLIPGPMQFTPVAGTYYVIFSATTSVSNRNRNGYISIYIDGAQIPESERELSGLFRGQNAHFSATTIAIATVNGSQFIEARWRVDQGGTTIEMVDRQIIAIKLE